MLFSYLYSTELLALLDSRKKAVPISKEIFKRPRLNVSKASGEEK